MSASKPFFRDQGRGVAVVCLHSNASSSSQWRALSDRLSDRCRVIAVDGYGAGRSPDWPHGTLLRLEDEARFVDAVLQDAGEPLHLVGHSYGAAVALKLATLHPQRVRSIVVYEPTLFHLVAGGDPLRSPAEGIWRAASEAAEAIDRGDPGAAAERFIDFWMGQGSWATMPEARKPAVVDSMRNVARWRDTLFAEAAPVSTLASLDLPVCCLWGEDSPESSLSVVRVLTRTLPRVDAVPLRGLGHMGPITHPERVNAQIAEYLARH